MEPIFRDHHHRWHSCLQTPQLFVLLFCRRRRRRSRFPGYFQALKSAASHSKPLERGGLAKRSGVSSVVVREAVSSASEGHGGREGEAWR